VCRAGIYRDAKRPDIVILDLNLPRKDGRVVLADLKSEPGLQSIPVVIFTTSHAQQDIFYTYQLGANCFVNKQVASPIFEKRSTRSSISRSASLVFPNDPPIVPRLL
jgi:CheY-like chemotaxis protein